MLQGRPHVGLVGQCGLRVLFLGFFVSFCFVIFCFIVYLFVLIFRVCFACVWGSAIQTSTSVELCR